MAVVTTEDLLANFQKKFGDKIGSFGGSLAEMVRIPTGIFPFDLASGGGIPKGKITFVYGPESSGKTNLVLRTIASHQKLWPEKRCAFFDIENSFDPVWAAKMGVDTDKLLVISPDYAEQAVDMLDALIRAADVGLIALDSLAAMISSRVIENSAEKDSMGGSSRLIGLMINKCSAALRDAEKAGLTPTIIFINQVRMKVGFVLGDPLTMPGGMAPKHASSMTVRLYGTNIVDNTVSKEMPVRKKQIATLQKWKCPIVGVKSEWEMVMIPHQGNPVGFVEGWNTAEARLKSIGALKKEKKGWSLFGDEKPKLMDWQHQFNSDEQFRLQVLQVILKEELATNVNADGEVVDTSIENA